jgi:hypothetical protein
VTGPGYDTINRFDFSNDTIAFSRGNSFAGTDAAVTSGSLSTATFNNDLTTALAGHLTPDHAILFTATAGTLSGDTFLVIDGNGTAGYQAGADLVIRLVDPLHLSAFSTGTWETS